MALLMRLSLCFLLAACAGNTAAPPSVGTAERQMVAAANPLAAKAGLNVLRRGGTAADAAVAVQMALTVVEPQASGLGGGTILLYWDNRAKRLLAYDGLSSAPVAVTAALGTDRDGRDLAADAVSRGGRSVGVPGTLALLHTVQRAHGRAAWASLFDDGINLAVQGFAMPPYLSRSLEAPLKRLEADPAVATVYLDAGAAPKAGRSTRNPELAATLRKLAADGPEAFYRGGIAAAILGKSGSTSVPGLLAAVDLETYQVKQREPICGVFIVYKVCSFPPPAFGGISVLQQLAILDRLGQSRLPAGSPEAVHLFIEASRLARADRVRWVGDPDFVHVPVAGLIAADYIAGRASLVQPARSSPRIEAGRPAGAMAFAGDGQEVAMAGTSHVAIVDADGNAVSMTTTINLNFGAELMPAGFFLNNAMTNFATRPTADGRLVLNRMQPGKRPYTSMAPSIAFDTDGRPVLVVGAGGGGRIPDYVTQTIVGVLAHGLDPASAIAAAHTGAQNGQVELEKGTPVADLKPALEAMGHQGISVTDMPSGLQAIAIRRGRLTGAGDARRDGAALGD